VSTAHCKTLTLGAAEFCNSGRRLFKTPLLYQKKKKKKKKKKRKEKKKRIETKNRKIRISPLIFCLPFLSVSLCFSLLSLSLLLRFVPRGEEGGEDDVLEPGELGGEGPEGLGREGRSLGIVACWGA